MIDLLLVNPSETSYKRLANLKKFDLNCKVTLVSGFTDKTGYVSAEDIVKFNDISKITSAIGFGPYSLKAIQVLNQSDKIVLGNSKNQNHFEKYIKHILNRKEQQHDWRLEFISYKGRHVLCHAMFYNTAYGWKLIAREKQDFPFFSNLVENAIALLDELGIMNGPNQVCFSGQQEFNIIPYYGIKPLRESTKQIDWIWPIVLDKEKINPKLAQEAFYSWVEETGPSKRFRFKVSDSAEYQTSNPIVGETIQS